jgi:hypothetical protein
LKLHSLFYKLCPTVQFMHIEFYDVWYYIQKHRQDMVKSWFFQTTNFYKNGSKNAQSHFPKVFSHVLAFIWKFPYFLGGYVRTDKKEDEISTDF